MIQIFELHLAANETREVALSGEYFEIRNAVSPLVLVELLDRSGGVISRLSEPEQSDFVKPGHFETVRVTNGDTAQSCKFFVGLGEAGSRRTSGEVSVIGTVSVAGEVSVIGNMGVTGDVYVVDGSQNTTLSGAAYGSRLAVPAGGSVSAMQIWNPNGSGVNLVIRSYLALAGPLGCMMGINNSQLTSNFVFGAGRDGIHSRLCGGPNSLATGRYQNSFVNDAKMICIVPNGILFQDAEPIVVTPGYGLIIETANTNQYLQASVNFLQQPVS